MIAQNSSVHNSTIHIFDVERYVGWGCILNCFMLSSLPCSMLFADLLSLHLVTFLIFFYSCSVSRNINTVVSLHLSISTSPTHKWQWCICKLLLRHTETRILILLQFHVTEGSSGNASGTADSTENFCSLFDGVCMCVEQII